MSIRVVCPSCDQVYTLDESMHGKKVRCRDCKGVITVFASRQRRDDERGRSDERVSSSRSTRPMERGRGVQEDQPRRRVEERSRDHDRDDEPRSDRRAARARRDEGDAAGNNRTAILVGAGVGGALLLALVIGGLAFALSSKKGDQSSTLASAPPAAAEGVGGPAAPAAPAPAPKDDDVVAPDAVLPAEMAANVVQRVKKSTVYLRVNVPGGVAQGSGFFASERGIIITNAHVIGMLRAGSSAPRSVTVVVNSGESDERQLTGSILGVDQRNDLAVLRVQGDDSGLPPPLPVESAVKLTETQKVYIFGFPFGASLGKNITVSTSSVSSLRRNGGVLKQIQVNGGMHPGNSGGPVTDSRGVVVGVSVAGIEGTTINFAIPADFIQPAVERAKNNPGALPPAGPVAGGDMPPAGPGRPGLPLGPRGPGGSRRPGSPFMPGGPAGPPARGSSLQADLAALRGTWQSGDLNADDGSGTGTVKLHIGPRAGILGGRVRVDITATTAGRKSSAQLSYNFSLADRDGKRILVATSSGRRMATGLVFVYSFEGDRLVISGRAALLGRTYNLVNVSLERIARNPDDMPGDDPTKGDDPPAGGGGAPPVGGRGPAEAITFKGNVFSFIQKAQAENRITEVDIRGFTLGKTDKDKYLDLRAEGGILVGFQLGLGKFVNRVVVKSWRPIYLTKDGEKLGKWYGKVSGSPVTVKAKSGYVVSGISIRTGLGVDGLSLTFAKLGKNRLDLSDTYTSSHIGGDGGNASTIGGKGELFVGVTGFLSPDRSPCALGLVAVLP